MSNTDYEVILTKLKGQKFKLKKGRMGSEDLRACCDLMGDETPKKKTTRKKALETNNFAAKTTRKLDL